MYVGAVPHAVVDFGCRAVVIRNACAARDLNYNRVRGPAPKPAHFMAALGFFNTKMRSTSGFIDTIGSPMKAASLISFSVTSAVQ